MSDRVSVIDAAVGKLQCEVERQQEQIDNLTKMVESLIIASLHDEIERHEDRADEERDDDNERRDSVYPVFWR